MSNSGDYDDDDNDNDYDNNSNLPTNAQFREFARIQERKAKHRLYAILGGVSLGVIILAYSTYSGYNALMGEYPTKGNYGIPQPIDQDISESLRHYKSGNSATGKDKEVFCYVESKPGEKERLVCGQEHVRIPVQPTPPQPDPYAGIPVVEPTPDPITTKEEFRAPTEDTDHSIVELPARNTWLKDGVSTKRKDDSPTNTVAKSRPVLSKYCSRFLERKGVCRIPRGDYQPTAD